MDRTFVGGDIVVILAHLLIWTWKLEGDVQLGCQICFSTFFCLFCPFPYNSYNELSYVDLINFFFHNKRFKA